MHLNSLQQRALHVVDSVLGDEAPSSSNMLRASFGGATDPGLADDIAYLQRQQELGQLDPYTDKKTGMVGAISGGDLSKAIMDALRSVAKDKDFKNHLRALDQFAKAGDQVTDAQKEAALAASEAIGSQLKVAVLTAAIKLGVREGLQKKLGPLAGPIANIVAEPLAKIVSKADGALSAQYWKLGKKLVNMALSAMGRETVNEQDADLFVARVIGQFAGNLLTEIEKAERGGLLMRAEAVREQQQQNPTNPTLAI